jgi:hypothetical protein
MKLESVGTISVGDFLRQTFGQVDNFDGLKGTSLDAHTATNA